MKKFLIALLVAVLSTASVSAEAGPNPNAVPPGSKGPPPGHAAWWVCYYPYFNTKKWCHGVNKKALNSNYVGPVKR